jgi:short-subunit dehydrogenase
MDFAGSWVLVTGASSGLGEEFARQLAARRANLVLTARSGDKLDALAASLRKEHAIEAETIALDLGAPGGAARLCDAVKRPIDHLISNAGFGTWGPFLDGDGARAAEMVRLNFEALTVLAHHFVRGMVERKRGGVIHLASIAGFQATPYYAVYAASKAYVLAFSTALSDELRDTGVRCLALCPGPVPTGFQATAGAQISPRQKRSIMSAEECVRRALVAYEAGKDLCIPGAINWLGTVGAKLAPRQWVVRTAGKMMREKRAT